MKRILSVMLLLSVLLVSVISASRADSAQTKPYTMQVISLARGKTAKAWFSWSETSRPVPYSTVD